MDTIGRTMKSWLTLTKACKLINDRVTTRLPIGCNFLEMILFEVSRVYGSTTQVYLEVLYMAIFLISYYGMMRVEVAFGPHVLKAKDVNMASNKNKLLLILYTSKTHGLDQRPQKITISANNRNGSHPHRHFCPFKIIWKYIQMRGTYSYDTEQFFVFRDKQPVTPVQVTMVLKQMILNLGLDNSLYAMHSFRIGRTSDLIKSGYHVEEVQRMGRWKSNAVYRYIRS